MLDKVTALLETEGADLIEKHEDVIVEAMVHINDFQKDTKSFILNNPEEFIGENTEETYKNMRVFTEVATAQFISEVSNLYGNLLQEEVANEDKGLAEYL